MENSEKELIEGFNSGYIIAKYEPELAAKLEKGLQPTNEYTKGLLLGQKEFEKEKDIQKAPPSKDHDKDIERDR